MTDLLDRMITCAIIQIDISINPLPNSEEKARKMKKRFSRCADDPAIVELAENLKLLSDPNRLRMICLLLKRERCVCEVEGELGISQQLASHHLNMLKEGGFLNSRREGTFIYYSVERKRIERVLEVLNTYLVKEAESKPLDGGGACSVSAGGAAGKRSGR